MRVDLSKLGTERLALEWTSAAGEQRVELRGTSGLRGSYVKVASGFQLSNVGGEQIELEAFALRFGTVGLRLAGGGALAGVTGDLGMPDGSLSLELTCASLDAARLTITVGALSIEARVSGQPVKLSIDGARGELTAEHALFRDASVTAGELTLRAPTLVVDQLLVGWGERLRVEARMAFAGELSVAHPRAALDLSELRVEQVKVAGPAIEVRSARAEHIAVDCTLAGTPESMDERPTLELARGEPVATQPPLLDYALLDGLAGYLNVDVVVDMAVPILGRRQAVHRLRVPIEDGALNYRELEADLASLEDSLLDFSVREGALVLERGLPLISTRGRGKPLLVWPLAPADLALAQAHRVRLAMLPRFRIARDPGERPSSPGSKKLALHTMSLDALDAQLSLRAGTAPGSVVEALSVGRLAAQGSIHHDAGEAVPEGLLRTELESLAATLRALRLGAAQLSTSVSVGALRDGQVSFEDLRPVRFRGALEAVSVNDMTL